MNDSRILPLLIVGVTICWWVRLRRSSSAIGVGRYSGTVSAVFTVWDGGFWCWCNCVAIVLIACVNFSDISLLLVVGAGVVEFNAFAKTVVKLCKNVFCKIDVKSTEGVGFVVVELAAAAVDNWLISLLSVSFASIIDLKSF